MSHTQAIVLAVSALALCSAATIGWRYRNRPRAEQELKRSERRFRALIENGQDVVTLSTKEGAILYASPAVIRVLGYTPGELIGVNTSDLVHPDDLKKRRDRLGNDIETAATSTSDHYRIRHKDGSWRWVESATSNLLSDPDVGAIVSSLRDITAQNAKDQAIKEGEERYRDIIENANDIFYSHDLTGKILSWNRAAERILGYTEQEACQMSIAQLIAPEDLAHAREMVAQKLAQGGRTLYELIVIAKDGRRVPLEIASRLAPQPKGSPQIQGVARDIAERKRAEVALQNANEDLERRVEERTAELAAVNRELESFSYSVSHDLRAPLRSIEGFAQALLADCADKLDGQGQDYLQRVCAAARRMGGLIDDLLNLAKLTRKELNRSDVNLTELAASVADDCRKAQPEREIEFVLKPNVQTYADPGLLRVVLQNLIGNACKFTSKCPHARVEFGVTYDEDRPVYFVRDNGAGFEMEYASKLFGAFQRLHGITEFPGHGIGLATVQRIIHRHGGTVRAEGAVGKGATFSFTL